MTLAVVLARARSGVVRVAPRRRARSCSACVGVDRRRRSSLARLGGSASPESRHLIFLLPFFAIAVARGDRPRRAPDARGRGRADRGLVVARGRLGLGPDAAAVRVGAGRAAGRARRGGDAGSPRRAGPTTSCSATSRSTSARGSGTARFPTTVVPRADAELALRTLERQPSRSAAASGSSTRASGTTSGRASRSSDRAARARRRSSRRASSGRSSSSARASPSLTPKAYLYDAARAMLVGRSLGIGDADVNMRTVELAARERSAATGRRCASARATPGSTARSRTRRAPPARARPRRRRPRRSRAPRPPTRRRRPPSTNERIARPLRDTRVASRSRVARPCDDRRRCWSSRLGDLVLDVVVRLDAAARAAAPTRRRAASPCRGRPGGERRRLGRGARGPARVRRQARRGRRGRLAAAQLEAAGVELRGPVEPPRATASSSRSSSRPASARCSPTAASRRSSAPDELDPAWLVAATTSTSPGTRLLARARRPRGRPRRSSWPAQAAPGSASTSPRGARSATPARERFRALVEPLEPDVVFANEDEDADRRRAARRRCLDPQARRPRAARSTATSVRRSPVPEVVDTTGAGDALAAGWLVGGPELALEAAARCVQRAGSMP